MYKDLMPIKPVAKEMLYMKVADAIHSYIHTNKLQPGDKIPSERVLAEQLGTGRNSVREALRVLEKGGILEVKTGKGAFVTNQSSSDSIYLKLVKVNYIELLEIKIILEKYVLDLVMSRITEKEIAQLEQILDKMESKASQGIYAAEEDKKFHKKLLNFSGNRTLEQILANMINALDDYAQVVDDASEMWISTIPYHREIVDALKSKNSIALQEAHNKIRDIDLITLNSIQSEK